MAQNDPVTHLGFLLVPVWQYPSLGCCGVVQYSELEGGAWHHGDHLKTATEDTTTDSKFPPHLHTYFLSAWKGVEGKVGRAQALGLNQGVDQAGRFSSNLMGTELSSQ